MRHWPCATTVPTVTDEQLAYVHYQLDVLMSRNARTLHRANRPFFELTEKTERELSTYYKARPYWAPRGKKAGGQ